MPRLLESFEQTRQGVTYMQAITTKYHGPTNYRGSRITARCQARRLTVSWDHSLNSEQNHRAAAMALVKALGWEGTWVGGGLPDGRGNVFVCVERAHEGAFSLRPDFRDPATLRIRPLTGDDMAIVNEGQS